MNEKAHRHILNKNFDLKIFRSYKNKKRKNY